MPSFWQMFFKVSAMNRGEVSSSMTQGPARRKKRSARKPFKKSNFVVSIAIIFCKGNGFYVIFPFDDKQIYFLFSFYIYFFFIEVYFSFIFFSKIFTFINEISFIFVNFLFSSKIFSLFIIKLTISKFNFI